MYQIFGLKKALTSYAIATLAIFIAWYFLFPARKVSPLSLFHLATSSATIVAALVFLLGQTPLFEVICKIPGLNKLLPPLSGPWATENQSNWPRIKEKDASEAPLLIATGKFTIIARLLYVRINYGADSTYSGSKTVFVHLTRDEQDGTLTMNYIYENKTPNPVKGDVSIHYGAARLAFDPAEPNVMKGEYWTNRGWHEGHNTAGVISIKKIK